MSRRSRSKSIKQGRDAITLGQVAYACKLLEKAGMGTCNPCHTPMEVRLKLSAKRSTPEVDVTMYRSLVGSLRYLVHTRLDITFAVGHVSRFMEKPRQEHLAAVKHILRYIARTVDYGIVYPKCCNTDIKLTGYTLTGYTDSDLGETLMRGGALTSSSSSLETCQCHGSLRNRRRWPSQHVKQSTWRARLVRARLCGLCGCWATSPASRPSRRS